MSILASIDQNRFPLGATETIFGENGLKIIIKTNSSKTISEQATAIN